MWKYITETNEYTIFLKPNGTKVRISKITGMMTTIKQ